MRTSRATRILTATFIALTTLWLAAGTVLAHAELETSDPEDGAVLAQPPSTITLTFSADLDPAKSSFRLLGPDGNPIGRGEVTGDREMALDGLTLAPGDYLIRWTSASAEDGDIERGQLTFTVAEAASTSPEPTPVVTEPPETESPTASSGSSAAPSAAPTEAASPAPTTSAPSAAPTPAPSATPSTPAASTTDVLLPIILGLLLVAGVGAFVLRRSRGA